MDGTAVYNGFASWWRKPFDMGGTAVDWFLFVGLVLVVIFIWTRVLKEAGHVIGAVAP